MKSLEKRNSGSTTRRENFNQLAPFCRRNVIDKKTRHNLVFDPGGCSGSLCGCLFLRGRRAEGFV